MNTYEQLTEEQLMDALLERLSGDSGEYSFFNIGNRKEDKKRRIRSLMNVRIPKPIPQGLLNLQDMYLQKEADKKGTVSLAEIPSIKEKWGMTSERTALISLWQGDITRLEVGAIVNAANSQMLGCFVPCHGCIDNAIHSAAGLELRQECFGYMEDRRHKYGLGYEEPAGSAVLTKAYNLPCQYVIHTVGPIVGWKLEEKHQEQLRSCYESCLDTALQQDIRSVAFCCISTGEFHFPQEEAAQIAIGTTVNFLESHPGQFDRIIFNVFKDEDKRIYEKYLRQL